MNLRRFLVRSAMMLLPMALMLGAYVAWDPFKVLRVYADYYKDGDFATNRDVVSTESFLRDQPVAHYDSFIFGSSRSLAFLCSDWSRYLSPGSRPFHFDASAETLFGITGKLRMLDRIGAPIDNALLIVDQPTLARVNDSVGPLFIKDPASSGRSRVLFHGTFVTAFVSRFFLKYMSYRMTGRVPSLDGDPLAGKGMRQVHATNDLLFEAREQEITTVGDAYWVRHADKFSARVDRPAPPPVIGEDQRRLLAEIRGIFDRHHTRYRIVYSPVYDQTPMNTQDRLALERIFGRDEVRDYAGKNRITSDVTNYYEEIHYRPQVGRTILEEIYAEAH